jgi:hypothetical protein
MDLKKYKTILVLLDAQLNYTQILLIHFLCSGTLLFLKIGLEPV